MSLIELNKIDSHRDPVLNALDKLATAVVMQGCNDFSHTQFQQWKILVQKTLTDLQEQGSAPALLSGSLKSTLFH
jgi:hypothetical protein